ncbi:hypothetical protein AVEN_92725-1 [Araneus ventricosus]|uniref:Uncharacterized protein n=1 Tax=Araneus ventricosus TaxID=182803 RepID=A0A4Y2IEC1_ARAVE|nr:hypothetical protein AVEN_92725-1 [Araneus ventricosus]
MAMCPSRIRRVPGLKPDSIEDPSCIEPAARQARHTQRGSKRSPLRRGAEVWRGGVISGVVRHLTEAQSYEVDPNIALVLLQTGTLNMTKLNCFFFFEAYQLQLAFL